MWCVFHFKLLISWLFKQLSYRLDVDGNGELNANDFQDEFAAIDQQKKKMYAIILEKFDFDDNKTISKTEFYDGFLLMASVRKPAFS